MRDHFVYTCYGEDDDVLYVGLTSDILERIKNHRRMAFPRRKSWLEERRQAQTAAWFPRLRWLSITGPFEVKEGQARERELIQRLQPPGNVRHTVRDPFPWNAARSAAVRDAS
jgi:hypothetical protein